MRLFKERRELSGCIVVLRFGLVLEYRAELLEIQLNAGSVCTWDVQHAFV